MGGSGSRLPRDLLGEYQANPFRNRICRIFSTAETGEDALSFEDFLDLLSVFSDSATPEIKSHYAFRLFDFDDDGTLDKKDLEKLVNSLTGEGEDSRLSLLEMEQLIQNILEESDIDKDGTINLSEFQHIISRSPDFTSAQFIGSQTNVSPRLSFPKTGCSTRVSPFTGVFQDGLWYQTSYPPSNGPSHTGQRNVSQVPTDPEEAHRQVVPFHPLLAVLVSTDCLS
ncbi:hypothetical protein E2320_013632 [Naja naja]|nr:hypothetical protein E2320_013632 [Naja naja]